MATCNEINRIKTKKMTKVGARNAGQKGSRATMNMWKGDTTMLFASGWGMGMMNIIRIHRASKSRTVVSKERQRE